LEYAVVALITVALFSASLPSSIRHEVKLRSNAASGGAVVEARINGHRLRLLLDTGARDIVISASAASRCHLSAIGRTTLSGMNGVPIKVAQAVATADFDGLRIENMPVRIVAEAPVTQADGLLGTQVFRDYVVEIDAGRGRLRLLGNATGDEAAIPFRTVGHMMFVPFEDGYALLDTGSSYSVVDRGRVNASAGQRMPVRTASGAVTEAQRLSIPARFDLGNGAVLWDRHPVAVDLSALSQKHGLDVRAVIGYPALRGSVIQVDYREQTLRFVD
jgi:predicted aspartyl protease